MKRKAIAAAAALTALGAVPAFGSGGWGPEAEYVDHHGGNRAELARRYDGRLGIAMGSSPAGLLYVDWRLLHGFRIGAEAGADLAPPYDDLDGHDDDTPYDPSAYGPYAWRTARSAVPGVTDIESYIPLDRPGPDYTSIANCYPEAFERATATLRARIASYGADSPAVRAWLATQDAVFDACANPNAALPAPMADAPAWLRADRAYQEAAFELYNFRNAEAALRFAAIMRDRSSPWRGMGLYLAARALHREALAHPGPVNYAISRRATAALADSPDGTYGKGEARKMRRALQFREQPQALLAELDRELGRRDPPGDALISLWDYVRLARGAEQRPDAADWILTMQTDQEHRTAALAHGRERWAATHDVAWLVAALTLANPDDPAAAALVADGERVAPDHVAWLGVQYHLIRLTIANADPAAMRARLDALLARTDLMLSERNLFTAARAQVAADLADFARFALRRPYCLSYAGFCEPVAEGEDQVPGEITIARQGDHWIGLGADARALIDRLPLADRIALSRNTAFPAELRLDLALTGFARAVLLQDNRAIDMLAGDLSVLLPQVRADWQRIAALPPGPDKRFAEFLVMAKIPGLRVDFETYGYTRPQGNEPDFAGHWVDWMLVPPGASASAAAFPPPGRYGGENWSGDAPVGGTSDLTCLGECGPGAFPLHLPPFAAASQGQATAERARLVVSGTDDQGNARPMPANAASLWDEALDYARAHPRDPRSPEMLYRLIRVARWGGNHDHLGRRAFQLLHARYASSDWARRSPYYYDDPVY